MYEFHISRHARNKYKFDQSIFQTDGNVIISNFHAARLFSSQINQERDLITFPEKAAHASEIYAIGLIDEVFHQLFKLYREKLGGKNLFDEAYQFLVKKMSTQEINQVIELFLSTFPPSDVFQKKITPANYIATLKKNKQYELIMEEIILLWVENQNPALENYLELFPETLLTHESAYPEFIKNINEFFRQQLPFGPQELSIIDMLLAPARAVPNSISGQLEYIRVRWGSMLGDLIYRLISAMDFLQEEEKMVFAGPGPAHIPSYNQIWDLDAENFSPDQEWMPSLVLIAKNAFVWLDQLTKKYGFVIDRLDLVPNEELDLLSQRGFTGLWLIGLWERSEASATIKKLCGNPDAIASAYSLASYQIADQLGGDGAYGNLKQRAFERGIRLASDMVPNHMGIDSDWVHEHPDWFINLDYSPFPAYSFNGPDLSSSQNIEIKIEDHYYDRSDAAVVFQYRQKNSGETKYIYHGNDGTTMPWNDTAQLNYLLPTVREAVYQTILSVARKFSIIRFDAAMTLAKKHYQRLWFPEPGSGGAIPSRSEFGLSKAQFDQIMPTEFWRDVVDRLAVDAPDTLLLAEAFWLMESYFVRTLGMHRVYNSAFMNMLRNEDNANYRELIKNTLEFDPQILKRFVNFMNNPDEKTAVEQFGKGDKYFGICTMMTTLPGLPMFGHGQIEGYAEKYGMEFKKAYWDEKIDENLVQRHEKQIVPILHRRSIFSEVENFNFYDFLNDDQSVNEDVFAYSNFAKGQASLVVYHNKYAETSGRVNFACKLGNNQTTDNSTSSILQLFNAMRLDQNADFIIYKDIITGLEFICAKNDLLNDGFHFHLHAYQTHVMVDFRSLKDDEWGSYRHLMEYLHGNGVPDIEDALKELLLKPVHQPLREIFNRGYFDFLLKNLPEKNNPKLKPDILEEALQKCEALAAGIFKMTGKLNQKDILLIKTNKMLKYGLSFPVIEQLFPNPFSQKYENVIQYFQTTLNSKESNWISLLMYVFLAEIGSYSTDENSALQTQSMFSEWRFSKIIYELGQQYGYSTGEQQELATLVYVLLGLNNWLIDYKIHGYEKWLRNLVSKQEVQQYLLVNRFKGTVWFNEENFENLVFWLVMIETVAMAANPQTTNTTFVEEVMLLNQIAQKLRVAMQASEFKLENLIVPQNKIGN
ncbi:MAG: alpha-amylase [Chloroflexi bacterium 44-23]|nr:MAG: alpha-amylase [Chloroflexi bacterium 44-23]